MKMLTEKTGEKGDHSVVRIFTDEDFKAFPAALNFKDGQLPVIAKYGTLIIVVDENQLQIVITNATLGNLHYYICSEDKQYKMHMMIEILKECYGKTPKQIRNYIELIV